MLLALFSLLLSVSLSTMPSAIEDYPSYVQWLDKDDARIDAARLIREAADLDAVDERRDWDDLLVHARAGCVVHRIS